MQHRFKRWWGVPALWPICFAIFFGLDPAQIDFSRTFDIFTLLETFAPHGEAPVINPAVLSVITAMLEQGLKTVTREQTDPDSPLTERSVGKTPTSTESQATPKQAGQRSMTLKIESSTTSKCVRFYAILRSY